MFSRFLLFFGTAGAGLCAAEAGRRELGARFPAKPCSSVSFAPSLRDFSASRRRRFGARFPAKPCSSVSFAPSPGAFSAIGRRRLGARFPAKPCSSVSFAPSSRDFSGTGRFHPIKTPSRKRRVFLTRLASQSGCAGLPVSVGGRTRFIFSCYSLPRPLPRPATRRSTSVSFISSDTIMPSISSSFSTSSSGKRFRIRWQTMFM